MLATEVFETWVHLMTDSNLPDIQHVTTSKTTDIINKQLPTTIGLSQW